MFSHSNINVVIILRHTLIKGRRGLFKLEVQKSPLRFSSVP